MVPDPPTASKDVARKDAERRRLTQEMLRLDQKIDQQPSGSQHRLELLRQQASLSDRREALSSRRP